VSIDTLPSAEPGADERLPTTLAVAVLLHGLIILGVSFAPERLPAAGVSAIEVTLVQQRSERAPERADYLAQANLRGAGNTAEQVRPRAPSATSAALDLAGIPVGDEWLTATPGDADLPDPDLLRAQALPDPALRSAVTTREARRQLATRAQPVKGMEAPRLMIAHLMEVTSATADPVADANQDPRAHSRTPRERFVAVNAAESRYARYLEGWRRRVERLGNRNYPAEARSRGLEGRVVLEIVLNADGTVRELSPRRSSGHGVLDDAALRSVRSAQPFAPFPPELRADTDVLRFLYEWRYASGELSTRASRG
jgi:protein TonB